jgi:hypothetical protein
MTRLRKRWLRLANQDRWLFLFSYWIVYGTGPEVLSPYVEVETPSDPIKHGDSNDS